MARTKPTKPATKGHVRLVAQVLPEQLESLIREAEKRRKPGQVRADVSAVVRDAIETYVARKR